MNDSKRDTILTSLNLSYKTDKFMAGVIKQDVRSKSCTRSGCSGGYVQKKLEEFVNEVPVCDTCGKYPAKLRIRMTLPGSPKKDIRYTIEGRRLDKPSLADATLEIIRGHIRSGTFDPLLYVSRNKQNGFLFKNFCNTYLKSRLNNKDKPLSPAGQKEIESLNRNYLVPYFGDLHLREITDTKINIYETEWQSVKPTNTDRQKHKSLGQLKSILKFAKRLGVIKEIPNFPELKKARRKKQWIDSETQEFIISNIKTHQGAFRLMQLYMLRPCEVRALKWKDFDKKNGILHVRRHFSNDVEIPGRKGIHSSEHDFFDHQLPLYKEAYEVIKCLPVSLNKDDYVFQTSTGKPLYESALRKIWNKTLKDLSLSHIDMYSGVKRSRGQHLINSGALPDQLRILMGHTSINSTRHYVRESAVNLKDLAEELQRKISEDQRETERSSNE